MAKTPKARGEPGRRAIAHLDQLVNEYGSDTIARLRKSIQAGAIIERLQAHIRGELELSPTQIQAASLLLQRCLPTLTSVELSVGESDKPAVVRAPAPIIDAPSWQRLIEHETAAKNGNGSAQTVE